MKVWTSLLLYFLFNTWFGSPARAQSGPNAAATELVFPVPDEPNMLFYIQRNVNENTIVYALNTDAAGNLIDDKPVDIFWRRYQEDGRRAELDLIQRTFAYGMRTKDKGHYYDLRCVAYDKTPLFLYKSSIASKRPQVLTVIGGRTIVLKKIFVQIEGGSFWFPNVMYAELSGTDAATGELVVERIMR